MAKLLLVEDNDMNRDMLSRRLIRSGYQVCVAVDGGQALLQARTETPDLILMDVSLPVLDGWAVTGRLKAAPETCCIPIIALTAHAMHGDRERSFAAGCDEYETKPVEMLRLLAKIEYLLQRKATA